MERKRWKFSVKVPEALHQCSADVAPEALHHCFANVVNEALLQRSADVASVALQFCFCKKWFCSFAPMLC
ncbi:hypothetical protein [Gardnerella vaginalis]|uniref:hypothetical protein n=1 Tax=Gardnerella vaginalis TaxID=2702 RepID=UPI0039F143FF